MKIQVTDKDIRDGSRNHSTKCPLAIAMRRALGCPVRVGRWKMEIYESDAPECYPIPSSAIEFREAFDAGLEVRPFSFEIPH